MDLTILIFILLLGIGGLIQMVNEMNEKNEQLQQSIDYYDKWYRDCLQEGRELRAIAYQDLYMNIDDWEKENATVYTREEWE